jgi:hypothetical protein
VVEKSGSTARSSSRRRYRPGIFTRFVLLLGVLAYSLLPLLASWPAIHARSLTFEQWQVVCLEAVILQVALWLAATRCGYEGLWFWQGASLVAGSMKSGWVYIDTFHRWIQRILFSYYLSGYSVAHRPGAGFQALKMLARKLTFVSVRTRGRRLGILRLHRRVHQPKR